jgi:hypothetical protein
MDHQKIVIGTEIYKSARFSELWVKAAHANLNREIEVIVFDNNRILDGINESWKIKDAWNEFGFKYFRLLPNCHQNHSVEMLRQHAVNVGAEIYIHLDIDCPPLKGVVEKIAAPVIVGSDIATEQAGAFCFAARTKSTTDLSCQRMPYRDGECKTRFSEFTSPPDYRGIRFFDHCRWMFHEIELRGGRVDIVNNNPLHATVASLGEAGSQRAHDLKGNPELIEHIKKAHEVFWNNDEVKALLCQK